MEPHDVSVGLDKTIVKNMVVMPGRRINTIIYGPVPVSLVDVVLPEVLFIPAFGRVTGYLFRLRRHVGELHAGDVNFPGQYIRLLDQFLVFLLSGYSLAPFPCQDTVDQEMHGHLGGLDKTACSQH